MRRRWKVKEEWGVPLVTLVIVYFCVGWIPLAMLGNALTGGDNGHVKWGFPAAIVFTELPLIIWMLVKTGRWLGSNGLPLERVPGPDVEGPPRRRFLHVHVYRQVGQKGANSYYECRHGLCRKRKVRLGAGHSPVDRDWLDGRESWEAERSSVPPKLLRGAQTISLSRGDAQMSLRSHDGGQERHVHE